MGATYKSPRVTRPGQSIFIATPAYELVKPGYAYSLAMTTAELTKRGIPFEIALMQGNCHVDDGRNSLVADFLFDTQCTDLVFIDSDLRWDTKMFMQLISHDTTDIIAGAYPYKSYPIRFPIGKILNAYPDGKLDVSYAPTGFMRIPRSVFEKLQSSQTKRGSDKPTYRFFERRYTEKTYDGGDVTFCRKWIAQGGRVIVDPKLVLEHIGEWRWSGCFLDYLAKDANRDLHTLKAKDPVPEYKPDQPQEKLAPVVKAVPKGSPVGDPGGDQRVASAINELLAGKVLPEHFSLLADAWGNKPWAATNEYLQIAFQMADNIPKDGVVLECGSGISTVLVALAAKRRGFRHIVLEHTDEWLGHIQTWLQHFGMTAEFPTVNISRERKWYDYTPSFTPSLIIIDGPPHYLGTDRLYPLIQPWIGQTGALIDDASTNVIERLKLIPGYWAPSILGGRPAAYGRAGVQPVLSAA